MATLKEHQNAMVDLLANGSAIPASAARLAHALHDVLGLLLERDREPLNSFINDVRLAADLSAVPPRGSPLIDNLRDELANANAQLVNAIDALSQLGARNLELYAEIDELKTKLGDKEEQLGY